MTWLTQAQANTGSLIGLPLLQASQVDYYRCSDWIDPLFLDQVSFQGCKSVVVATVMSIDHRGLLQN